MFDFVARSSVIVDHLAPVWRALPASLRGQFVATSNVAKHCQALGIDAHVEIGDPTPQGGGEVSRFLRGRTGPCVVAYFGDLRCTQDAVRETIVFEHGTGQRYKGHRKKGWEGKLPDNRGVKAFLAPNEYWARIRSKLEPDIPVHVVGTPKLDRFAGFHKSRSSPPTVAVSFRWRCKVCPECTGSFDYWQRYLPALLNDFQVIGHAHPNIWKTGEIQSFYQSVGIECVEHFDEVLQRADLYAIDNSSTLFEFAATDRPVLVLNPPTYRKNVHHGLRFWEYADVGVNCDSRKTLVTKVHEALEDAEPVQRRRREISALLFPYMGASAERAAAVLAELVGVRLPAKPLQGQKPAIGSLEVIDLPACRCRGPRQANGRYRCTSQHLVARNGVSASTCRDCPFVDRIDAPRGRRGLATVPAPRAAPPRSPAGPCVHLGTFSGEKHLCETCKGHVEIKVRSCKLHGRCTPATALPGIACCSSCSDRRES